MKQFIVLRVYALFDPFYVASFDNFEDATTFAKLSKDSDPGREYVVAELRTQATDPE